MENHMQSAFKLINFYKKIEEKQIQQNQQVMVQYLEETIKNLEHAEIQLKKLPGVTETSNFHVLFSRFKDKKRQFINLHQDFYKPLSLYVIGKDNSGKSRLTKALLNNKIITTENNRIDVYIKNGKTVEIIKKDNDNLLLDYDEAMTHLKENKVKVTEAISVMDRNMNRKKSKYENNERALNELQSIYQKEKNNVTDPIVEVRWPMKDRPILNNFSLALTGNNPDSNLFYNADCILYMLNMDELYRHKTPDLINSVKNKKVIAVINRTEEMLDQVGEIGINRYIEDVKRIYGRKISAVAALSLKDASLATTTDDLDLLQASGLKNLESLIEANFLKHPKRIKINAKKQGAHVLLTELTANMHVFIKKLKENDNKRLMLRYDFRKLMLKEANNLKIKADWFLNNYELQVKNNIEVNVHTLINLDQSHAKDYLENHIFEIKEFLRLSTRLKGDLTSLMQKFYSKNISTYRFKKYKYLDEEEIRLNALDFTSPVFDQDHEILPVFQVEELKILDSEDVNEVLSMLTGKMNLRLPFIKKKKLNHIQSKLVKVLEENVNQIKKALYMAIDARFNDLYLKVYHNIETSFLHYYCHPTAVNQTIKILDHLERSMALPLLDVSAKDIILGKKKFSH